MSSFLGEHYASLEAARTFLEDFLCHNEYIGPRGGGGIEDDYNSFSRSEQVLQLRSFATIKSLFGRYPILASYRFDGVLPITYFIWNGFDVDTLEAIYSIYPEGLCVPQMEHPNLLELACNYLYTPDETILWLLSKCDDTIPEPNLDGFPRYMPAFAKLLNVRCRRSDSCRNYGWDSFIEHEGISDQVVQTFAAKEPNLSGYSIFAIDAIQTMKDDITILKKQILAKDKPVDFYVDLPASILLCDPKILKVLLQFLQSPPVQVTAFTIIGHQSEKDNHERLTDIDRILELWPELKMGATSDGALQKATTHLLKLLAVRAQSISCIELDKFQFDNVNAIANLAQSCRSLVLNNSCLTSLQTTPSINKTSDHWNIAVWQGLAKLPDQTYIEVVHTPLKFGKLLNSNPNSYREMESLTIVSDYDSCDVTSALVTIIEAHSTLKNLHYQLTDGCNHPNKPELEMDEICEALSHNISLQTLKLDQLSLDKCSFRDNAKRLLQVVKDKNTSLQEITIEEHQLSATRFGPTSCGHHIFHESGRHLQYALRLNKYGRGKLRNKTTLLETFLGMISRVKTSMALEEQTAYNWVVQGDKRFQKMHYSWGNMKVGINSEEFSFLFSDMRGNVGLWSHVLAGNQATDILSILYGLMRETPHLWCNASSPATTGIAAMHVIVSSKKRGREK